MCRYGLVDEWAAGIIGGLGGLMTIVSLSAIDYFQIDDACGATAVHLVCGGGRRPIYFLLLS